MNEIQWCRPYNGRLLHAFTGEYRQIELKSGIAMQSKRIKNEQKTLCGKWFAYYYDAWDRHATFGYPHCKNCEKKAEVTDE